MTNIALTVVCTALAAQSPEWKEVADAVEAKHANDAVVSRLVVEGSVTNALEGLRANHPRYVIFVMTPDEITFKNALGIRRMMRDIDEDPFDDALWGVVTGPTAADAKRIAASDGPKEIKSALTTTGAGDGIVPGGLVCISDAFPKGEWRVKAADGTVQKHQTNSDTSHVFAEGWNDLDPDFILTSSHASQRNLEMPFSRGNIVPVDGRFETRPSGIFIDYKTGQAKDNAPKEKQRDSMTLNAPKREKVWLAAGNCLIADNLGKPNENMIMTALGFGKVNQFVGYIATTWFGDVGWNTWGYFGGSRYPLSESYFAANQWLLKRLTDIAPNANEFRPKISTAARYDKVLPLVQRFPFKATRQPDDPRQFVGWIWDRDATFFYGDPMVKVSLHDRPTHIAASKPGENPRFVIFPDARKRRLADGKDDYKVFIADDFAFILEWPEHEAAEEAGLFVEE